MSKPRNGKKLSTFLEPGQHVLMIIMSKVSLVYCLLTQKEKLFTTDILQVLILRRTLRVFLKEEKLEQLLMEIKFLARIQNFQRLWKKFLNSNQKVHNSSKTMKSSGSMYLLYMLKRVLKEYLL